MLHDKILNLFLLNFVTPEKKIKYARKTKCHTLRLG